jgi:RNA polymerase sigma factor CnrH
MDMTVQSRNPTRRDPLHPASPITGMLQRAIGGEQHAFACLMMAHKPGIVRIVRWRTRGDQVEDIVQETFLSAWCAISRFDPERAFEPWLRSIARNKCNDHARRAHVRRDIQGHSEASGSERVRDDRPLPVDELIANEELVILDRAMAGLPVHLRDALFMTAVEGMSQSAAASALGCSVKSIEYRVHRARKILMLECDASGLEPAKRYSIAGP